MLLVAVFLTCIYQLAAMAPATENADSGVAVCRAVRALASPATMPKAFSADGLLGSAITDLSWMTAPCEVAPPSTGQVVVDSGWQPTTAVSLTVLTGSQATATNCVFRHTLLAAVSAELTLSTLNASVEIRCALTGSVAGRSAAGVTVYAAMWRALSGDGVPAASVYDMPFPWVGTLQSTPAAAPVVLSDADLFDGVAAAVLLDAVPLAVRGPGDDERLVVADMVLSRAGDLNLRLNPLTAAPSALLATLRGGFLPASGPSVALSTSQQLRMWSGVRWGTHSQSTLPGVLVQIRRSCTAADSQCFAAVLPTLQALVIESVSVTGCGQAVSGGGRADITADVYVASDVIELRAVAGSTFSVWQCGSDGVNGTVGLWLGASADTSSPAWPLDTYINSPERAAALAKSVPISTMGRLWGTVLGADGLYTAARSDIVAQGSHGGIMLADAELHTTARLQAWFAAVVPVLSTGGAHPLADQETSALFAVSRVQALVSAYTDLCARPTDWGFWQWVADNTAQLQLLPRADGQSASLHVLLSASSTTADSALINAANAKLQQLGRDVHNNLPDTRFMTVPTISTPNSAQLYTAFAAVLLLSQIHSEAGTSTVTAVVGPQVVSTARLHATFTTSTLFLFDCVDFQHDYGDTSRDSVTACMRASRQHVACTVGYASGGTLLFDAVVGSGGGFARGATQVSGDLQLYSWMSGSLPMLTATGGQLAPAAGVTWTSVLGSVANALAARGAGSQWFDMVAAMHTATDQQQQQINGAAVLSGVAWPAPSQGALVVDIKAAVPVWIGVQHMPDRYDADLSRFRVPTLITTRLQGTWFSSGGAPQGNFVLSCAVLASDWSVPIRYQMLPALLDGADAHMAVHLALPSSGTFSLSGTARSAGETLQVQLVTPNIASIGQPNVPLQAPVLMVMSGPSAPLIAPEAVLSGLRAQLSVPTVAAAGVFSVPLPPLDTPLDSLVRFSQVSSEALAWISLPQSTTSSTILLAANVALSLLRQQAASPPLNITLNGNSQLCAMQPLDLASLDTLVSSVNARLADCGLSSVLRCALASPVDSSAPEDGTLALYGIIPGLVGQLNIVSGGTASQGQPLFVGSYRNSPIAAFGSFDDMAHLMSAALQSAYQPPQRVSVPPTVSDIVAPALLPVAPSELPGVVVPFSLALDDTLSGAALNFAASFISRDESVQMQPGSLLGSARVRTQVEGSIGSVFSALPNTTLRLDSNISQNLTIDYVVLAPNTTFTLVGTYSVLRSAEDITDVTVSQQITLPSGVGFLQALNQALPAQLSDPLLAAALSITLMPASPLAQSVAYPQISLSLTRINDTAWLVPRRLSIANSTVLGLLPQGRRALRSFALSAGLTVTTDMQLQAQSSINSVGPAGAVGVLSVAAQSAASSAALKLQMVQRDAFALANVLGTAASMDYGAVADAFSVAVDTLSRIDLLDVAASEIASGISELDQLTLKTVVQLRDAVKDDLSQLRNYLSNWTTAFNDSVPMVEQAWRQLANLTGSDLCVSSRALVDFQTDLQNLPVARESLPFSSRTLGDMLQHMIGGRLQDWANGICSVDGLTLKRFCDELSTRYGSSLCGRIALHATNISVDLTLTAFNVSGGEPFHLNSDRFFPQSGLPLFESAAGSTFSYNAACTFVLRVAFDWGTGRVVPRLVPGSGVTLTAGFEGDGAMGIFIGPLPGVMAGASTGIGQPARFAATLLDNQRWNTTLDGHAWLRADFYALGKELCWLNIEVPALRPFLEGLPGSYTVNDQQCGGPGKFVEKVLDALENMQFSHFLQDCSRLLQQLEQNFAELFQRFLLRYAIPFLGRELEHMLAHDVVGRILGPAATKEIVQGVTQIAVDLTLNKTQLLPRDLEQLAVDLFTALLCRVLPVVPGTCPAPPDVSKPELDWQLTLGRNYSHRLASVSWPMGGHGPVELDVECKIDAVMRWQLQFTLVYTKTHGISIRFDRHPVFNAPLSLEIEPNCLLTGRILFMAADMRPHVPQSHMNAQLVIDKKPDWDVDLKLQAVLIATTDLGLAGLFGPTRSVEDALVALPHYNVTLTLTWDWDLQAPLTAPDFHVSNGIVCIGSTLSHLVRGIARRVDTGAFTMMKPLLDKGAFLRQELPVARFLTGRSYTVADFMVMLARDMCHGGCVADGLLEALYAFDQFYELLLRLSTLDPYGCKFFHDVAELRLRFEVGKPPTFELLGAVPPLNAKWFDWDDPSQGPPPDMSLVVETWSLIGIEGSVSITYPISQHIPENLLKMLMAQDVVLVQVQLPSIVLRAGIYVEFDVWPWPEVTLGFGVDASISATCAIGYGSRGIVEAIEQRNAGLLPTSLGLVTRDAQGNPKDLFIGHLSFYGQVGVGVYIFSGWVTASVSLDAGATYLDPNGDAIVSFEEVYWLVRKNGVFGAMTVHVEGTAGFGISIRACIHIKWVGRYCWTIVSFSTHVRLFEWDKRPPSLPSVADARGNVNLGMLPAARDSSQTGNDQIQPLMVVAPTADGAGRRAVLSSVDAVQSPAVAPQSRSTSEMTPISTFGDPGSGPFTLRIDNYGAPFTVSAPLPEANLTVLQSLFPEAGSYAVSRSSLWAPNTTLTVSVPFGGCRSLNLLQPLSSPVVNANGAPCPLWVEGGPLTNLSLAGNLADYAGGVVTLLGNASWVTASLAATEYTVSSAGLRAANDDSIGELTLSLQSPGSAMRVSVVGHPLQSNNMSVTDTAPGTLTVLQGGAAPNTFNVAVTRAEGTVTLLGGGNADTATLAMSADAYSNQRLYITASAFVAPPTHLVQFVDVPRLTFVLTGAPYARTDVFATTPAALSIIEYQVHSDPQGEVVINLSGCTVDTPIYMVFTGSGNRTVVVGADSSLEMFSCPVSLMFSTDPGAVNTLLIRAQNDTRRLAVEFQPNRVLVTDTESTASLPIVFSGVQRLVTSFSATRSTDVYYRAGTAGTETHLEFSPGPPTGRSKDPKAPPDPPSRLYACATNMAVLATGQYTARIGETEFGLCGVPPSQPNAFAQYSGSLALAPSWIAPVVLYTGNDGAQNYVMDDMCLSPGSPLPLTPISDWMCALRAQHGFTDGCTRNCHLAYLPPTNFTIITGAGADSLTVFGARAAYLLAKLGDGQDSVIYRQTWTPADIDLGSDENSFVGETPQQAPVSVWLSSDDGYDSVDMYYAGGPHPSLVGSVIGPVGDSPADVIVLHRKGPRDMIYIHATPFPGGAMAGPESHRYAALPNDDVIWVNNTDPATQLKVDLFTGAHYMLGLCGTDSHISFTNPPQQPAADNFTVTVVLPPRTDSFCFITLEAKVNLNSRFELLMPAVSGGRYFGTIQPVAPTGTAFITIGLLQITLLNAAHVSATIASPADVTIYDSPCGADMAIVTAATSTVNPIALSNNLAVSGATITINPAILSGPATVAAVGSATVVNINGSDTSVLSVRDSWCSPLVPPLRQPTIPASGWFTQQLLALGVPPDRVSLGGDTTLYIRSIDRLSVMGSDVLASNLDGVRNTRALIVMQGSVNLTETAIPWSNVRQSYSSLEVDNRLSVQMDAGRTLRLWAQPAASANHWLLTCGSPALPTTPVFMNCLDTSTRSVSWSGGDCQVTLCARESDIPAMPNGTVVMETQQAVSSGGAPLLLRLAQTGEPTKDTGVVTVDAATLQMPVSFLLSRGSLIVPETSATIMFTEMRRWVLDPPANSTAQVSVEEGTPNSEVWVRGEAQQTGSTFVSLQASAAAVLVSGPSTSTQIITNTGSSLPLQAIGGTVLVTNAGSLQLDAHGAERLLVQDGCITSQPTQPTPMAPFSPWMVELLTAQNVPQPAAQSACVVRIFHSNTLYAAASLLDVQHLDKATNAAMLNASNTARVLLTDSVPWSHIDLSDSALSFDERASLTVDAGTYVAVDVMYNPDSNELMASCGASLNTAVHWSFGCSSAGNATAATAFGVQTGSCDVRLCAVSGAAPPLPNSTVKAESAVLSFNSSLELPVGSVTDLGLATVDLRAATPVSDIQRIDIDAPGLTVASADPAVTAASVQIAAIPRLQLFLSEEAPTSVTMNGGLPGTQMLLQYPDNPALLGTATVLAVSDPVLLVNHANVSIHCSEHIVGVVIVANANAVALDCSSSATDVVANDGFVTVQPPPATESPALSLWLQGLSSAHGVRDVTLLSDNTLVVSRVAELTVSAPSVQAIHQAGDRNSASLSVLGGQLTVSDFPAAVWPEALLQGSQFTVPGLFTAQVEPGYAFNVIASAYSGALTMACDGSSASTPFTLNCPSTSDQATVQLSGQTCTALVCGTLATATLPTSIVLESTMTVNLTTSAQSAALPKATLIILPGAVTFRSGASAETDLVRVEWQVPSQGLSVQITEGSVDIVLPQGGRLDGEPWPRIVLSDDVDAAVQFELTAAQSLVMSDSALTYDVQHEWIVPRRDLQPACLRPTDACVLQFWEEVFLLGPDICFDPQEELACFRRAVVELIAAPRAYTCVLQSDGSSVVTSGPLDTPLGEYSLNSNGTVATRAPVLGLALTATGWAVSLTVLFAVYVRTGRILDAGASVIALMAVMQLAARVINAWSVDLLAAVVAARQVALVMHPGWDCGMNVVPLFAPSLAFTVLSAGALTAGGLLWLYGWKSGSTLSGTYKLRVAMALVAVLLQTSALFLLSHVTSGSAMILFALIVSAVLAVTVLVSLIRVLPKGWLSRIHYLRWLLLVAFFVSLGGMYAGQAQSPAFAAVSTTALALLSISDAVGIAADIHVSPLPWIRKRLWLRRVASVFVALLLVASMAVQMALIWSIVNAQFAADWLVRFFVTGYALRLAAAVIFVLLYRPGTATGAAAAYEQIDPPDRDDTTAPTDTTVIDEGDASDAAPAHSVPDAAAGALSKTNEKTPLIPSEHKDILDDPSNLHPL